MGSEGWSVGEDTVSFSSQLEATQAFLSVRDGGLVIGDWNRVPCKNWRSPAGWSSDRRGDASFRAFCGWDCSCCGGSQADMARVVGGLGIGCSTQPEAKVGQVCMTRFESRGSHARPSSRIDMAVTAGTEDGLWTLVEEAPPLVDNGKRASDHQWVVVESELSQPIMGERRPLPIQVKGSPLAELNASIFRDMLLLEGAARDMEDAMASATAEGKSQVQEWVRVLRGMAEQSHALASQLVEARRAAGRGPKGGMETAYGNYESVRRRLSLALQERCLARKSGKEPDFISLQLLFHRKTGLLRRFKFAADHEPDEDRRVDAGWAAVVVKPPALP